MVQRKNITKFFAEALFIFILFLTGLVSAGEYQINYEIQNQWNTGFIGQVTLINNSSSAIDGWTVDWIFPDAGQTIVNSWNGIFSQSGTQVTVSNASYNGYIPSGGETTFGFQASYSGSNPIPTDITLNGQSTGDDEDDAVDDDDTAADDEDDTTGDDEDDTDADMETYRDLDVCKYTEDVASGSVDADGMVRISPNHPDILYFGRVDCSDETSPSFAFPGVSIRAKFEGEAIDLLMKDYGNSSRINYYNVIIDDADPVVLQVSPDQQVYELARNLSAGEHTVEIFKRIESNGNAGKGDFLGFRLNEGGKIRPLAPKTHRIEFIGNSITCGYGNEISTNDPGSYSYTTENSNAYNAWGAIAARMLDAEYVAVAYSGRGITRNYGDYSGETLPDMYLDTLPDESASAAWNASQYTPEVVVINLGTNDFSPGVNDLDALRAAYYNDYMAFLDDLRGYYPEATIILAVGPMLSDGYPEGYNALTTVRETLETIIQTRSTQGDGNILFLELPQQTAPYGEDWHPTVATHQSMAEELVTLIQENGIF
jgi:lysophospholipase L1-like esterase